MKIAGHVFGLENRYPEVEKTCRKYLCDEQPEAVFSVTQQKTDSLHLGRADGENESTALHACIVQHLIPQDYLLFHGSCLALDGQAILFTAPSGTGKSTHSRLWRERFGGRVTMINDDKPLLKFSEDGRVTAYGSPWNGHHYLDTNTSAPLAGIVVLKQAPENKMRRLSLQEAFAELARNHFMPDDFAGQLKATQLIGRLSQLPVFELACTPTQEAVTLSYETLMKL